MTTALLWLAIGGVLVIAITIDLAVLAAWLRRHR
jgi:hypothetical protein